MRSRAYPAILGILTVMVIVGTVAIITKSYSEKVTKSLDNVSSKVTAIKLNEADNNKLQNSLSQMNESDFTEMLVKEYNLTNDEAKKIYRSDKKYCVYKIIVDVVNSSEADLERLRLYSENSDVYWISYNGMKMLYENSLEKGQMATCSFNVLVKPVNSGIFLQDCIYDEIGRKKLKIEYNYSSSIVDKEVGTVFISNEHTDVVY